MIDPITIGVGALIYLAFRKQSGAQFGVVTAERQEVFNNAMAHCQDPQKLLTLANAFHKEGLKAEAAMLKKRAEWRGRPEAKRKEHADIYERAMKSTNVPAILQVAQAFEEMTATEKAKLLRAHAQTVNEESLRKASAPEPSVDDKKTNGVHTESP